MKQTSAGLLIISPQGWLLAHATRTPRWDIPKGRIEEGESALDAAVRECWEETGLDLSAHKDRAKDLGCHTYIKGKDLHVFVMEFDQAFDLSRCTCHTFVERHDGDRFPETDKWIWASPDQAREKMGKGLVAYFEERGLLPTLKNHNKP